MEFIIKIKKKKKHLLNDKWVWQMAWRDARRNFSRLFLFISSIIIGIAALVAINSFNENLKNDINMQAKDLLGADFTVRANKPFEPAVLEIFDTLNVEQSSDAKMASMVVFVSDAGGIRLVQLVAVKGDFPFYGEVNAAPNDAYEKVKNGFYAALDENIAIQYEVSSGDSIRVGKLTFPVSGVIKNMPGTGSLSSTFAPAVYIPLEYLDSTGLVQFGSRIAYKKYFKTNSTEESEKLLADLKPTIKKYGYSIDTVDERKEDLGRGFENMYRFFNLLGFVALILGCIGVASSVHIYVQEKRSSVAVLRCLGASGWQSFNIFLIQAVMLGILGSLIGVTFGVVLQYFLPLLLSEFLPIDISVSLSIPAILEGLLLGLIISILFSFLPLTAVRTIPPLEVLRTGFEKVKRFSKTRLIIIILTLIFPLIFAIYQTDSTLNGVVFFAALVVSFLALTMVAAGITI